MSKLSFPIFLFLLCLSTKADAQRFTPFQWENRVLLIMDSEKQVEVRKQQIAVFTSTMKEVEERDLLILCFTGDELFDLDGKKYNHLIAKIPGKMFQGVILVGKDGSLKLKEPFVVSSKEVFSLIDSMPMRQAEMAAGRKH